MPPFDPGDFLTLARSLASKPGATEAELRTAVSRAYYAVFLKARENLVRLGRMSPTQSGGDHGPVIATLRGHGGPHGDQLDKLRRNRGQADYQLEPPIDAPFAKSVLSLAGYLFSRI